MSRCSFDPTYNGTSQQEVEQHNDTGDPDWED
jgi:hypothetical protein